MESRHLQLIGAETLPFHVRSNSIKSCDGIHFLSRHGLTLPLIVVPHFDRGILYPLRMFMVESGMVQHFEKNFLAPPTPHTWQMFFDKVYLEYTTPQQGAIEDGMMILRDVDFLKLSTKLQKTVAVWYQRNWLSRSKHFFLAFELIPE